MLRHPNLVDSMEALSFNIEPRCPSLDHLDHLYFNIRLIEKKDRQGQHASLRNSQT